MPASIKTCFIQGFIVSILSAASLQAQVLKRLPFVSYNVNEGLLQSQVTDMSADGNGFIWISYGNGMQRFDGRNFYSVGNDYEPHSAADRSARFFRLQDGNLWISHSDGITAYNRFTHHFQLVIDNRKIPDNKFLFCITEDSISVWAWASGQGIYRIHKENYRIIDSIRTPPLGEDEVVPSRVFSLDNYFVYQLNHSLIAIDKRTRTAATYKAGTFQGSFCTSEKHKGDTLIVATFLGLDKIDCRTGVVVPICNYKTQPFSVNPLHPVQLRMLPSGICLVSEGSHLYELDMSSGKYQAELVNQQNRSMIDIGYITGIVADAHHNIWIMTENDGIRKINYRFAGFRYFGTEEKQRNFSKTIHVDKPDNRVLCGAFGWGMSIFDTTGRLLKVIDKFPGYKPMPTVCGFRKISSQHYLVFLMGTWKAYVLNTLNFTLAPVKVDLSLLEKYEPDLLLPDYHMSLHPISDSLTLVQSGYFSYRMRLKNNSTIIYEQLNRSIEPSVSSYVDKAHRFWIGSYGKYFVSDKSDYSSFETFELPDKKLVRSFFDDGKGSIWIGTAKGLYQVNEKNKVIKVWTRDDGLIDEDIYSIRGDRNGNIWFSHNKGISCLRKNKSFIHFSKSDGLQENEFNTNTSFETGDGELFFGGVNGVSGFYPDAVTAISETPQIVLTGFTIRDLPYSGDSASWSLSRIELPYNDNVLSFNFTAIGNRPADQYNYQYQLIGQDGDWVNGGNNPQVRYVLQPGNYKFRYYAGNSFEHNPASAKEMVIHINPPFWKTTWFIASAILILTSIVILLTRSIARRKLKKQIAELQQTKLLNEERLRISREMHDDIGAGLTQITLMSEAAKNLEDDIKPLEEIAGTSRKLVSSISEIIWSLNPENQSLEQLLAYLREQLNQLLEYSGIRYSIEFPENGKNVLLSNAQRRNLLLVTKEIVHNAVKHSRAKQINVSCHQRETVLEFDITDDGIGFNPTRTANGNGLHNIRRRIEELGGKISIKSYGDSGSHFFYSVPLKN